MKSRPVFSGLATYIGTQEGFENLPAIPLYNLNVALPGHPAGSTVSLSTLEDHFLSRLSGPKAARA